MTEHGVKVVIVEPGGVNTEMGGRGITTARKLASEMTAGQHKRYDALIDAIVAQAADLGRKGVPAVKAAKIVVGAVTAKKPRTRYTIGRDAAILVRLVRIIPDRLLDLVLRQNLKPHYPATVHA